MTGLKLRKHTLVYRWSTLVASNLLKTLVCVTHDIYGVFSENDQKSKVCCKENCPELARKVLLGAASTSLKQG